MADVLDLTFDRPKVVYRQISEQIRELIVSGRLEPGTKLPASAELAAKWQTHAATIHAALTPLVKEGLLTRQPRLLIERIGSERYQVFIGAEQLHADQALYQVAEELLERMLLALRVRDQAAGRPGLLQRSGEWDRLRLVIGDQRIDCAGRTINPMAIRKHDAAGAVTEQRDYGPGGEGALPIEAGTVMEVAHRAICP